jgi:hypothetical protein
LVERCSFDRIATKPNIKICTEEGHLAKKKLPRGRLTEHIRLWFILPKNDSNEILLTNVFRPNNRLAEHHLAKTIWPKAF